MFQDRIDFRTFVAVAAGFEPMSWQCRLACGADANPAKPETMQNGNECESRLIDVPTGCGKTAGAVLAWLWNRIVLDTHGWPRRLVYCLPMRTLVEQTERKSVLIWLLRLGLGATEENTSERANIDRLIARLTDEEKNKVRASLKDATGQTQVEGRLAVGLSPSSRSTLIWLAEHSPVVLMGGEEPDDSRRTWDLYPEKPAVLIGTQDMLVSRALNRGYGMSRYRWPMHFGLLNTDCLWVLDEVQLMSSSLTTSLQLQAWRQRLEQREGGRRESDRPASPLSTHSWWMSATAAEHWFKKSIAMRKQIATIWQDRVRVDSHEAPTLLTIPKTLHRCSVTLRAASSDGGDDDARAVAAHLADPKNRKGRKRADDIKETDNVLTLVICNTVDRAVAVYGALRDLKSGASQERLFDDDHLLLLHSRFRAHERAIWPDKLMAFERGDGPNSGPRIVVATQVIEAGVDISAPVLYTELCPLASLIQRLGRCARRAGESGKAFWIDFHAFEVDIEEFSDDDVATARPYDPEEIGAARKALQEAERRSREASTAVHTVASEPSHA